MKKLFLLFCICYLQFAVSGLVFSQWTSNTALNTPVSIMPNDQQDAHMISDTKGGAIIVWEDFRNDSDKADVVVQRINSLGYPLWTVNGINICAHDSDQGALQITADGFGGAILCWNDHRNGDRDIYAQRIDSSGNALWLMDGVPVCIKPLDQTDSKLASDGNGGAIIVWQDSSLITKWDIYAQRISSTGTLMWAAGGVPITNDGATQRAPHIRTDGAGGAIIVWQDKTLGNYDIFAKRINSSGIPVWGGTYGSPVSTAIRGQSSPRLEPDGAGGAIIAWEDKRNIPNGIDSVYDIYAQRVDASGNMKWMLNGIPVDTAASTQDILDMIPDGSGGTILVWKDFRNGNDYDIYAQRIDSSGTMLWLMNGAPIDTSLNDQASPSLTGDGAGGAVIVYKDSSGSSADDIYSVKINSTGVIQWKSPVGTAPGKQKLPRVVSDGAGGCIYAFQDKRNSIDWDIYVHHLYWNGTTDGIQAPPVFVQSKCFPNPFSVAAVIELPNTYAENITFSVYNLLGAKIPFPFTRSQNKLYISRGNIQSGLYFYEIRIGNNAVSKGKLILTDAH